MVTLVGAVFLAATAWALIFSRRSLIWVLSAAAPFPATAAVTVGENSVPPFYIVAAVVTIMAFVHWIACSSDKRTYRATLTLLLFIIWTVAVTLLAPRYFEGIEVLVPRAGIDEQVVFPGALSFSVSNIAQLGYLIFGAGVVWYISQQRGRVSPHALTLGFALGSVLSSVRYVMGDSFPGWVFDNYHGLMYWPTEYMGVTRFRGVFPEPSYLAVFSLAAAAYFIAMWARTKGAVRVGYSLLLLSVAGNIAVSYSGTAALGLLVLAAIACSVGAYQFIFERAKVSPAAMLAGLAGVCGLAIVLPTVLKLLAEMFEDKQGSLSFANRTAADLFSFQILGDTLGFGAGLGSSRPSSMLAMLASNVGVVGLILFLVFLWFALKGAAPLVEWRPTLWALVGLLIGKFIAEPALSTPLLWFSLALCIHAAKTLQSSVSRNTPQPFKKPSVTSTAPTRMESSIISGFPTIPRRAGMA